MADSYSQWSEDRDVLAFFGNKSDGFFVEVGAYDPELLSSSLLLEQSGWKGVLIEPQPDCCERLRARRKAVVCQAACGARGEEGTTTFYVSGPFSGLNPATSGVAKAECPSIQVQVRSLDSILEEHAVDQVDFISIDVEGTELNVLRGFNLAKYKPKLILIEDHVYSLAVHNFLKGAGYKLIRRTGSNNWYLPVQNPVNPSIFERLKLFRKMYLGLPLRKLRLKRNKSA